MDDVRFNKSSATLIRMAEEEFGRSWQPTQAERKLLTAVTTEDPAICGSGYQDDDGNNPAHAGKWSDQRSIDAKLIHWLCADRRVRELVDPRGIQIQGAKIAGNLNLQFLVVSFPLRLDHCAISGKASLDGLEIPRLSLQGSWVGRLSADGIRVKGDVFLGNNFRANGEVLLLGAQIGGTLDCSGGKFINPQQKDASESGHALRADRISVGGSLFLNRLRAEGEVALRGSQVGGDIQCMGGEFANPPQKGLPGDGVALCLDGTSVKGPIFLNSHFEGEVSLLDTRIGGSLMCDHGVFINPKKDDLENSGEALILDRATIASDVFLQDGFRAVGSVSLLGARIEGNLYCQGGDFTSADLELGEASARSIHDTDKSWPKLGHLHLNGFVYRLADPRDADTRLKWLELQPKEPFYPEPYLQLAKVLADAGDEDGRIKVLVAMKDREWAASRRGFMAPLWRWPLKVTAGYGYRPLLAFWEVIGLSALGWILYRRSYLAGGVVPTDKDAYQEFKSSGHAPNYYRHFSPLVYSVENSLPLVKLGQGEKWQPDPSPSAQTESIAGKPTLGMSTRWPGWLRQLQEILVFVGLQAPPSPDTPRSRASRWGTSARFLRWFLWAQILLGWLLATLFLAGISGVIKKG